MGARRALVTVTTFLLLGYFVVGHDEPPTGMEDAAHTAGLCILLVTGAAIVMVVALDSSRHAPIQLIEVGRPVLVIGRARHALRARASPEWLGRFLS